MESPFSQNTFQPGKWWGSQHPVLFQVLLWLALDFSQLSCAGPLGYELLISLLWCVHNYIFWNKAKPKNNLAPPQLPSLPSCTWSSHQMLMLPRFPTSATSNNNKTWKGLSCPLYSYNKMDVDLAVLFPSAIWQCSLSFSPSLPCEEWVQLIMRIRDQLRGACASQGNFFPWMPIAPHLWCLMCISHSPSPESSEVTGQKQLLSLGCADQITSRGFSLVNIASKIFPSNGQFGRSLWRNAVCYIEASGQEKPQIKALNRQDPFGQFISFSFLLWFLLDFLS